MSFFQRLRRLLPRGARPGPPVRLVTDSTADLPPDLAQELDITVVPLQVIFGDESFRDGIDLTSDEFFRRLRETDDLPRTSQPSVGDFQRTYEEVAGQTDRILSIHVSSGFSGTVEAARQAAQALADRCQIEILDSRTVSMSMGLAVIAAARAAREGADLEACAEAARSVLERQRIAIAVDTLEYLRRGGRIGRAQAFLGSLLKLKPILTIRDGEAHPVARARTRRKALDAILRLSLDEGEVVEAAVMHTTSPEDASFVAQEIARRFPNASLRTGHLGPVIGVHGGPGVIGIVAVLAEKPSTEDAAAAPAPGGEEKT